MQDGHPSNLYGRKYTYSESAITGHFHDLSRCVALLCASKDRETILAMVLSRNGYFYRASYRDAWMPYPSVRNDWIWFANPLQAAFAVRAIIGIGTTNAGM